MLLLHATGGVDASEYWVGKHEQISRRTGLTQRNQTEIITKQRIDICMYVKAISNLHLFFCSVMGAQHHL